MVGAMVVSHKPAPLAFAVVGALGLRLLLIDVDGFAESDVCAASIVAQCMSLFGGFLTGVLATITIMLLVRKNTDIALLAFGLVALTIEGLAVVENRPPLWFGLMMLASVPAQITTGCVLMRAMRRRFAPDER